MFTVRAAWPTAAERLHTARELPSGEKARLTGVMPWLIDLGGWRLSRAQSTSSPVSNLLRYLPVPTAKVRPSGETAMQLTAWLKVNAVATALRVLRSQIADRLVDAAGEQLVGQQRRDAGNHAAVALLAGRVAFAAQDRAGLVGFGIPEEQPAGTGGGGQQLAVLGVADDVRHAQGQFENGQLPARIDVPDPQALFVRGDGQPLAQLIEGEVDDRPALRGDLFRQQFSRGEVPQADIARHVAGGQQHAAARELQPGDRRRMCRRELAHEFARGEVPDLDLRLVGGRRIDRVAVAGEQVAAVGREGDRRQALQFASDY